MTSIEPKVESIEQLDFDIKCGRIKRNTKTWEIMEGCNATAKYWAILHSPYNNCTAIRKELCEEHLIMIANDKCKICGSVERIYDYGPL